MIVSAALAVLSALLYGVSDFSSGLASRLIRVMPAATVSYVFAAVVMLTSLAFSGGQWSSAAILWGAVAGVFMTIGLLSFYAAMAKGPMSIASPLIAVLQAAVPVAVAIAIGDHLAWWSWCAIAAAGAAGVLLTADHSTATLRINRRTVLLAVTSGGALGLSVVALNAAPKDGQLIPGVCEIMIGLIVLAASSTALQTRTRGRATPPQPAWGLNHLKSRRQGVLLAAVGGLQLGGANGLLIVALHSGNLAIVGVLVSLYPAATITLARLVLHERLAVLQIIGVILALLAANVLAFA